VVDVVVRDEHPLEVGEMVAGEFDRRAEPAAVDGRPAVDERQRPAVVGEVRVHPA